MKIKSMILGFFSFSLATVVLWGGASQEIELFSSFNREAIQKIKPGEILTAKGSLMGFDRGISSETCFLAAHPIEKVVDQITFWDQTPYPDLGIFIQGKIGSEGTPDFSKLIFIPSLRPVAKFMDKVRDTRANESPLHLSTSEAAMIAAKRDSIDATTMSQLWGSILKQRFSTYQQGGLKALPDYSACKTPVKVGAEVDSLLEEQPGIAIKFGEIFEKIKTAPNEGQHYWQLQDVDGTAVIVLGTIYINRKENKEVQVVDLQWYVTSGYYTAFTCYDLYPLEMGKTEATLIWRGDYTSISMKQLRKGVERMFSVNVMIQEVKKSIRLFLEDLGKH